MRYLRKIASLALLAVAMTAAFASTAAAEVTVSNSGPFTIDEATLHQGTMSPEGMIVHWRCDYDADGYIDEDGAVTVENIDFLGGSSVHCRNWEDCGNGWSGQVVGPGDPDYLGVADFEALMTVCLHNGASWQGEPFEARLHINGGVEDQQWSWPMQQVFFPAYNLTINAWVGSDPLDMNRTNFEIALEE